MAESEDQAIDDAPSVVDAVEPVEAASVAAEEAAPPVAYKEDPSIIERIYAMEEGSVIEKHAQGFYVRPVVSGIKQHGFGKTIAEAFASIGAVSTPE